MNQIRARTDVRALKRTRSRTAHPALSTVHGVPWLRMCDVHPALPERRGVRRGVTWGKRSSIQGRQVAVAIVDFGWDVIYSPPAKSLTGLHRMLWLPHSGLARMNGAEAIAFAKRQ